MYSGQKNAGANRIRGWPKKNTGADTLAQNGVAAPWLIEIDSRLLADTLWDYVPRLSRPILISPISTESKEIKGKSFSDNTENSFSKNFIEYSEILPEGVIFGL
jgi:hypothetical protein